MQIGDKVHLVGTVMDIQKGSVLVLTLDAIHQREYWFLEKHVEAFEPEPPLEPGEVRLHPGHALPETPAPDQTPEQEAEVERKREAEAEAEAEREREREREAERLTPPPPTSHRPAPPVRRR